MESLRPGINNTASRSCGFIREIAGGGADLPVGFGFDTCHLLAPGFDISTQSGHRATIRKAEEPLGPANVHLSHAKESRPHWVRAWIVTP